MKSININNIEISSQSECYVIAEIGNNHQGSLDTAKKLAEAAKSSGANAVKTQRRNNSKLYTSAYYNRPYDNPVSFGKTYGEHREYLELSDEEFEELQTYCKEIGISFFSTAFDFDSAEFLESIDIPAYKIASGDLKSIPLIKHIAKFGKPIIVSTGGAKLDDVIRMYDAIIPLNSQLIILQCTAAYPCPPELLNLKVIETYIKKFPESIVGLSDHYNGILSAPLAYMIGARVIEKHFTLNHTMKGTDHAFSLEPDGMRKMVRDLKRTKLALGNSNKDPLELEKDPLIKMGKKLVASQDLKIGHKLTYEDISLKSPGDGLEPYHLEKIIGKSINRAINKDENILLNNLD